MNRYYVHISSVTGNTKKLAEHVLASLEEQYQIIQGEEEIESLKKQEDTPILLLFFWCRRATADPKTLKFLSSLKGYRILAFGTMGSYIDTDYGKSVRNNVIHEIERQNQCVDVYLCRGKVNLQKSLRRRQLPKDHKHYLSDEGFERHLSSQSHPDEEDLKKAIDFLKQSL